MSFIKLYASQVAYPLANREFLWYRHPHYNIALGMHQNTTHSDISAYCLKLHPIDVEDPDVLYRGEYFCDPDSIISVVSHANDAFESIAYLPYIMWDRTIVENDQSITIVLRRKACFPPQRILSSLNLPIEIVEKHTMSLQSEAIKSTVTVTNRHTSPVDILYCYQDAAVMWLENTSQKTVAAYTAHDGIATTAFAFKQVHAQGISCSIDKEHAVFAAVGTTEASAWVGTVPYYLGFDGHFDLVAHSTQGVACFDGKARRPEHILRNMQRYGGVPVVPDVLKNRAVAFHLKAMQPDEERVVTFFRMGRHYKGEIFEQAMQNDFVARFKEEMGN